MVQNAWRPKCSCAGGLSPDVKVLRGGGTSNNKWGPVGGDWVTGDTTFGRD
jgi:hypothetical protein